LIEHHEGGSTVRQTNTRTKTARRFFIGLAAASRMIRAEAGLSQREVARRGGVSERLVSDVEKERANPTATCLDRLAKGLGLGVDWSPEAPWSPWGEENAHATAHDSAGIESPSCAERDDRL
jgi:transcriptional regulator with XRE-family HTH domain